MLLDMIKMRPRLFHDDKGIYYSSWQAYCHFLPYLGALPVDALIDLISSMMKGQGHERERTTL